ncbi:hypothetical protein VM1G_10638 [Cytospora mali]|uniref:Uncharacterized protein n=1 Tax=Cytospora mali TaxID=578113 RepID=A0A194VIB9_CYTMA|nr:hypothetical protein VM1G_10638 [Valsa mali]
MNMDNSGGHPAVVASPQNQALGFAGYQGIPTLLDMVFDYKSNHATSQNQSTSSEALENTPMETHNRRHPDLRNTAISRDIIAKQQLGPLYNKHKQYEYGVIDTRATMKTGEDALNARAEDLLVKKVPNPDGAKKSKFYCHSCYDSYCDWKSRHVKNCHMQDPDSDPLLICPQCFRGIRAHHHGLEELDAYMVKHKQNCDEYMRTSRTFGVDPVAAEMYRPIDTNAVIAQYPNAELRAQKQPRTDAVNAGHTITIGA